MKHTIPISAVLLALAPAQLWAQPADPSEALACETAAPLEGQRLLRRLSLDLAGRVPSYVEVLEQRGRSEVPEATIDRLLASPEFTVTMRRHHESLLWPNLDQVEIVPEQNVLFPLELTPGNPIYLSFLRAVFTRAGGNNLYLPCKDEPARFDAEGRPIADPVMVGGEIMGWQEGWVEVEPYWAPGTSIKVCAFDAQGSESAPICPGPAERYPFIDPICQQLQTVATQTNTPFAGTEASCSSPLALLASGCGCGPNLAYCHTAETLAALRSSLLAQELGIIDRVIAEDRPYDEVLRTKRAAVNGPIAHYLTHQSRLGFDLFGDPDPTSPIPSGLTFPETERWVDIERTGRHSGVLTTPGYLLRFQSNRGRAHRFYNAFECSSFIPAGPLPSPFEPCSKHEDLTQRCGCDACHVALEPMASHWGRFAEYGFSSLDEQRFPARIGPTCTQPFRDLEHLLRCVRFYEVEPVGEEQAYFGMLNAYVFRTPAEHQLIEAGPAHLVAESVGSGRFATCSARRMWTHFMRRAPTPAEEAEVLPELVRAYEAGGSTLRSLVRAIVLHPAYRRLP